MRVNLVVLFFVTWSSAAFGLNCSKGPLVVTFINGVWNKREDARSSARALSRLIGRTLVDVKGFQSFEQVPNIVKAQYNHTQSRSLDVVETAYFKLRELMSGVPDGLSLVDALLSSLFIKQIAFTAAMRELGVDPRPILDEVITPLLGSNTFRDRSRFVEALRPHAQNGDKILILSHSEGTLYANMIIEELRNAPSESKLHGNFFASLMLGPATSKLPRNSSQKVIGKYLLNSGDLVVKGVTGLSSNMGITANANTSDKLDVWGHKFEEIYLSSAVSAIVDGKNTTMDQHFTRKVREAVEELVANEEGCCGIASRGKFWVRSESCNDVSCLGGFVADDVEVQADANLELDKSSELCDNVKVSGNVFLSGASVSGTNSSKQLELAGGSGSRQGIILAQDVEITGSPLIEGDLTITQAKIIGNGTYRGTARYAGDYLVSPLLTGGSGVNRVFSGNNNISGTYVIDTNLHDVTVEGGFQLHPVYDWITFDLYGSVGTGATIKGVGGSTGTIGPGVTVHGITYGSTDTGAGIDETSQIKGNSTAKGSFLLSVSSKIEDSDYEMNQVDGTNVSLVTGNSTIKNANVFGLGGLFGSNVIGGSINASKFLIKNATLNNVTVSGSNIALCRQIFNGGSFGSNTSEGDCSLATAKQLPDVSRYLASRQEMFKRRYFKVMDRIQEIKQTTR